MRLRRMDTSVFLVLMVMGVHVHTKDVKHRNMSTSIAKEMLENAAFKGTRAIYVLVEDSYPQNKQVSTYCPSGTVYNRHACGRGAVGWQGSGSVAYGPHSVDQFLDQSSDGPSSGGHCDCCCNCNMITVECFPEKCSVTVSGGKPGDGDGTKGSCGIGKYCYKDSFCSEKCSKKASGGTEGDGDGLSKGNCEGGPTTDVCHVDGSCGGCTDKHPDSFCKRMHKNGFCTSDVDWMKEQCSKTCGYCCDNFQLDSTCKHFQETGVCTLEKKWMIKQCPKTCGYCNEAPSS